jgi:hypothetical protein
MIEKLLDQLSEIQSAADTLHLEYEGARTRAHEENDKAAARRLWTAAGGAPEGFDNAWNDNRKAQIISLSVDLSDIDAEYDPLLDAATENANTITQAIKAAVIENGATVKGAHLMAVYSKPRVTWDGKILDGYAVAHPEINAARKVGEPSVSIRSV